MNKRKIKLASIVFLMVFIVASIVVSIVYAAISTTSTRGQIEVSTVELDATTTYTSSTSNYTWTYTQAGDYKEVDVKTKNSCNTVLHNFYSITATGDSNLLAAIMVYLNDEYICQLSEVNNLRIEENYSFIQKDKTLTEILKFELHQSAKSSIFDGKQVSINLSTYTENLDYLDYIFINNEKDFKHAIDDVNSGLFTNIPSIVLCNTLTLEETYTVSNPLTIYLNGCTLGGELTLNDTTATNPDALIKVLGDGTFNVNVNLGANYDEAGAIALVKENIANSIGTGILAGSTVDILGYYDFYGLDISAQSYCTYSEPNVTVANSASEYYTKVASINVDEEVVEFKIIGSKTALLDATLAYMPAAGETITSDLFLPTYIPSQNANITWTSSNESVITNTGMITAERLENVEVTLYAEIRVNERVMTRTFTFKVSAHNNEINFYKLVQEISPLVIDRVWTGEADNNDALYYLPIVSQNADGTFNSYDYRTSYKSPVNTEMFDWQAFKDIGLDNITYSMTDAQLENYDYITQTNNTVCLNTTTLNNYAQITITGDFGNNETYSTNINISISVGSNTQLLEKAFEQVSEELEDISVLANIINTRKDNGMANEKGDFSLSYHYIDPETDQASEDYTIRYSGAATIIDSITYNSTTEKYDFVINPEYFNEYETTVAFTATVYYKEGQSGETSKSRTFYVTVPAALHIADFGTISIYNSTKYQVYKSLLEDETDSNSGYSISGGLLTDSNLDYILLRDIVGDATYIQEYKANDNYLEKIGYTSTDYVGVESLTYQTKDSYPTSTTDRDAYDFARLIEWATGDSRATASSVVNNTSALGSYASNKANAQSYLNNDEIAVLKQFYMSCTGATEVQWTSLFSEVFNVAPGYIYTNPTLLNTIIKLLNNNSISWTSESYSTLFGKYMEILQRYAVSTTKVNANDVAPCQQQYNSSYTWYHSETNLNTFSLLNNNGTTYDITVTDRFIAADRTYWLRGGWPNGAGGSGGDGNKTGFYATTAFAADRTSYITAAERQVVMMFWLNVCANNLTTAITSTNQNTISSVLSQYSEYYDGYFITDFDTVAEAIINGFDACMEIPTYFATDGVAKIIKSFYDKVGYDVPSFDGTTSTSPFISSLNGNNIPYITNADNIKSVLSYFTNLKTLSFIGNTNLAAFLSENGLATVFARTGLYNTKIESLTMTNVAHKAVNFDLSNIKNFTNLKTLDLSKNKGIQSVNELVNVNRGNYSIVNIEEIGVEYEYQEFAIENIASNTCTVRYTNEVGTNTYTNLGDASLLAELSDFNKFITQYMYMTNVVYDSNGNPTTVTWRIDKGNEINSGSINNAGDYPSISTIDEMNEFISPYYYCNESFTYTAGSQNLSFTAKHLYRLYYENGVFKIEDKGEYNSVSDLPNLNVESFGTVVEPDVSSVPLLTNTVTTKNAVTTGTVTYSDRTDWFTDGKRTGIQKTDSLEYTVFSNEANINSNRKNSLTLPSSQDVNDIISNAVQEEVGATPYNITYTVTINIQSKNYNGNNNNSLKDAWQHGLYISGNINKYSTGLVYGGQTVNWGDYDSNYLGNTIAIKYFDNDDYGDGYKTWLLYPDYSRYGSWKDYIGQSFYLVKMTIDYTCYYDDLKTIYINYNDGSNESITNVYAAGWRVKKSVGATIEYTETESTISVTVPITGSAKYLYYDGNTTSITDSSGNEITYKNGTLLYVVPQYVYKDNSRSRTYRIVGTLYTWEFWYVNESWQYSNFTAQYQSYYPEQNSQVRDGENISSITINDTTYSSLILKTIVDGMYTSDTTRTNLSGFDVDWETVPLTSTWDIKFKYYNYLSYVEKTNSTSVSKLDNQVLYYTVLTNDITVIFNYTGPTGDENVYNESTTGSSTSYYNNYGYKLNISNNQLSWTQYSTSIANPTGDTMDSILANANQHFGDYHYGEYYGKYYGYNGNNFYSTTGYYYEKGYIYRIMPNVSNTAFTWVKISTFTIATPSNMLLQLGTGVLSVGDIVKAEGSNAFSDFFSAGWYKVTLDEKTNIVNLVKFNDMSFATNGIQTYTQLTNDKLVPRSGDYLGYSGTFTVQISALIRTYDSSTGTWTEHIKTYKLKFVGSLTS